MPTGVAGAYRALSDYGDHRDLEERLTSLVWLRILTDPAAPMIGGNDPRTILSDPIPWADLARLDRHLLSILCGRLNEVMGERLLHEEWPDLEQAVVEKASQEVGRWRMPDGDPLGVLYQELASKGTRDALGQFFTPYEVSLLMARMLAPESGKSVCDPACGSGGMLLAALETCRAVHGPEAILELYGVDISASAVRLCKLNLALAGIAPNPRVFERDTLLDAPPEIRPALEAAVAQHDEQLGLFG